MKIAQQALDDCLLGNDSICNFELDLIVDQKQMDHLDNSDNKRF